MRTYRLVPWLWLIVAALNLVLLVRDIMAGAPSHEHEALMMLALVLARIAVMSERW